MDSGDNPYQPPATRPRPKSPGKSLLIGDREPHEISMSVSIWSGRERYFVDGQLRLTTMSWWGVRRLQVGTSEKHEIEFQVGPAGTVKLVVDGRLVDANFYPELKITFFLMVTALAGALSAVVLGTRLFIM